MNHVIGQNHGKVNIKSSLLKIQFKRRTSYIINILKMLVLFLKLWIYIYKTFSIFFTNV
jgi:hypothetical protein